MFFYALKKTSIYFNLNRGFFDYREFYLKKGVNMNKNNKIKMITVSIFVAILSISVNGIAKEVDKKQQDNIKQLKELIISRLNLVHELSLKQIAY